MITDRINNNLSAIFNIEDDDIFKALINNIDGTIPGTVNKPTDFDIGVIASQIEYLRQLSITLLKQMYADEADTEFLEYTLETFFESYRLLSESDSDWLDRTIDIIFSQKISDTAIIYALLNYSSTTPVITTDITDAGFADFSYCDIYQSGDTILNGETVYFLAAIMGAFDATFFTFKVTLHNTEGTDIQIVINILNNLHAAGISYILEIIYD